jgi:hypothetical protein
MRLSPRGRGCRSISLDPKSEKVLCVGSVSVSNTHAVSQSENCICVGSVLDSNIHAVSLSGRPRLLAVWRSENESGVNE